MSRYRQRAGRPVELGFGSRWGAEDDPGPALRRWIDRRTLEDSCRGEHGEPDLHFVVSGELYSSNTWWQIGRDEIPEHGLATAEQAEQRRAEVKAELAELDGSELEFIKRHFPQLFSDVADYLEAK